MSFIHVKRQTIAGANGEPQEGYAIQAIAIHSPQGQRLIPNPAGNEAATYPTLEAAEAAIKNAGFDYIFEGKKVFLTHRQTRTQRPEYTHYNNDSDTLLSQAVPVLIKRLSDRESTAVTNATFALGEIRDKRAIPALIKNLGHEDATVRKTLALAIAKLGEETIAPLFKAFDEALESHRQKERYSGHIRLTVMTSFYEMCHTHRELLDQILPKAIHALEDPNWLVRAQAALVVGQAAQYFRLEEVTS